MQLAGVDCADDLALGIVSPPTSLDIHLEGIALDGHARRHGELSEYLALTAADVLFAKDGPELPAKEGGVWSDVQFVWGGFARLAGIVAIS